MGRFTDRVNAGKKRQSFGKQVNLAKGSPRASDGYDAERKIQRAVSEASFDDDTASQASRSLSIAHSEANAGSSHGPKSRIQAYNPKPDLTSILLEREHTIKGLQSRVNELQTTVKSLTEDNERLEQEKEDLLDQNKVIEAEKQELKKQLQELAVGSISSPKPRKVTFSSSQCPDSEKSDATDISQGVRESSVSDAESALTGRGQEEPDAEASPEAESKEIEPMKSRQKAVASYVPTVVWSVALIGIPILLGLKLQKPTVL